jgi:hypothetical protein
MCSRYFYANFLVSHQCITSFSCGDRVIDSINPNAMAVQVYLLSTPKPVARSIAFILGDFVAAWLTGLLL